MRWRLLFIFMLLLPSMAAAQGAVLSGEHDGFTRIVAPIPVGADWNVQQIGRTVIFSVDGTDSGFDTSDIFRLIPRERITSVASTENTLTFELGCDCSVAPFVAQDRFIVMDVTSPGVSRPVPFVAKSNDEAATSDVDLELPVSADTTLGAPVTNATPLLPIDLPSLARQPLTQIQQGTLEQMQQRLSQELGTAATRGLLSPAPRLGTRRTARPQVDLESVAPDLVSTTTKKQPTAKRGPPNNMRITSSMDLHDSPQPRTDPQSLSGLDCPSNETLNITDWSNGDTFSQQLGVARQSLYQEFDRLDYGAVRQLAKLYIHYGFGAEAMQTLRLNSEMMSSEWLIMDIAQILEIGHSLKGSSLPDLIDCQTDVALWAILARQDIAVSHTIDPSAALLALNRLPLHLRQVVAPALSDRLLSHGNPEAAETALRTVERLPSAASPPAKLSRARIALDQGETEQVSKKLSDVIDDNTEQSPEALIMLVETRFDAGHPIDSETAALIDAYAKEYKGSALGPALHRAHVLALAKSGQFDAAFDAVGSDEELDEAAMALRLRLLEELTETASDVVFVDIAFNQLSREVNRLPPLEKIDFAKRLVDLGFVEEAQPILESVPDRPRHEARQLLLARIALNLSQPRRAQAALIEMSGQDVDRLRAEAMRMAGDFSAAATLFDNAGDELGATQSAWLAGEDTARQLTDDPLFGAVVALDEATVPATPELEGMLARGNATLEESTAARQTLMELLQSAELGVDQ